MTLDFPTFHDDGPLDNSVNNFLSHLYGPKGNVCFSILYVRKLTYM